MSLMLGVGGFYSERSKEVAFGAFWKDFRAGGRQGLLVACWVKEGSKGSGVGDVEG